MKYNPEIHNRRSIRLKGYDYSQAGLYYITICVQNRECLFGKIVGAHPCGRPKRGCPEKGQRFRKEQPQGIAPTGIAPTMQLNDAGQMVHNEWLDIPNRFPQIQLHEFIVMPNHFHAIMEIVGASPVGAPLVGARNGDGAQNRAGAPNQGRPQGYAPTDADKNAGDQNGDDAQNRADARNKTVGDVVGAFKSITTNEYIDGVKNHNWPRFNGKLWQRNYWEHIIRNEKSYQRISDYIINNPLNWADDKFYRA